MRNLTEFAISPNQMRYEHESWLNESLDETVKNIGFV